MDTRFIEASNGVNYGKFMVARFDMEETLRKTAMPEAVGTESFFSYAGLRRMTPERTLVMDLQTGEGAEFSLRGGRQEAAWALRERHPKLWVCPLFPPFLGWLFDFVQTQPDPRRHELDLESIPNFIDLTGKDAL